MVNKGSHFELSIYSGELTAEGLAKAVGRLSKAFPGLTEGFHDVFADRIKEIGFSNDRLMDAVNHVIDNCQYPQPTIAQFIGFDKRVKMYDYQQIVNMNSDDGEYPRKVFKYFSRLESGFYANNKDIEKYGLK